jgi:RimJ/RimL family protein N-acetyltransferase
MRFACRHPSAVGHGPFRARVRAGGIDLEANNDGHSSPIARCGATHRDRLLTHFSALSADDRALRFCTAAADDAFMTRYVERLDFAREAILALVAANGTPAGIVQICLPARSGDVTAELAFRVVPAHRGRGRGKRLLALAIDHARRLGMSRVVAQVAADNGPMKAVFRAAGLSLVRVEGEFEATLKLGASLPLAA